MSVYFIIASMANRVNRKSDGVLVTPPSFNKKNCMKWVRGCCDTLIQIFIPTMSNLNKCLLKLHVVLEVEMNLDRKNQ